MAANGHFTGMRGVYLVAAELTRLGFIASPTSRSAIGADILLTDRRCQRAFSVQVKTNAKSFGFWLVGSKARDIVSKTHIYVLVNIRKAGDAESIEYYIVPSKVVAAKMRSSIRQTESQSEWHQINRANVLEYRDKWSVFGSAE